MRISWKKSTENAEKSFFPNFAIGVPPASRQSVARGLIAENYIKCATIHGGSWESQYQGYQAQFYFKATFFKATQIQTQIRRKSNCNLQSRAYHVLKICAESNESCFLLQDSMIIGHSDILLNISKNFLEFDLRIR